jgi:homogentisate 1,2-dioxygenase
MHHGITAADHLLTTQGHLDEKKGIEASGFDRHIAAIAHAPDRHAFEASQTHVGVNPVSGVQYAQTMITEDVRSVALSLVDILRSEYTVSGQGGGHIDGKRSETHA